MQNTTYMDFNFENADFHVLECWEVPSKIVFESENRYSNLVSKVSNFFGRNQELPDWVYNVVILGIQDGKYVVSEKSQKAIDEDVQVSEI